MIKFIASLLTLATLAVAPVHAQQWPTQPVKFVLNLPAGSGPDAVMRRLADQLSQRWNQPVVIENKPGASGLVAVDYYLKNSSDNHTIYFSDAGSYLALSVLYHKESLLSQLQPVAPISRTDWVVIAPANVKNFGGVQEALKARAYYGSWAVGSSGHVCGAEIAQALKIPAEHVPYKDYASWYSDVSAGLVSYSCSGVGSAIQMQRAGKVNFVAVTASKRLPSLPDVPTIKELLGVEIKSSGGAWLGLFVNKQTDPVVIRRLEQDLRAGLNTTPVQTSLDTIVTNRWDASAKEFSQTIKHDVDTYRGLTKQFNIRID